MAACATQPQTAAATEYCAVTEELLLLYTSITHSANDCHTPGNYKQEVKCAMQVMQPAKMQISSSVSVLKQQLCATTRNEAGSNGFAYKEQNGAG